MTGGKPFQSKLNPYFDLIRGLRRKRTPYPEIARILREQHGLAVGPTTIFDFVKVRSKKRVVYTMLEDMPPRRPPTLSVPISSIPDSALPQPSSSDPMETHSDSADTLIILTEGGKGGVGKTTFVGCLLDYYAKQGVAASALDLDTENKDKAGLNYFYKAARKVDIDQRDGLDAFTDEIDRGEASVIVADMGARSGKVTFRWFNEMFDAVKDLGVRFTAVGMVTEDPGSVASVLEWASYLKNRVSYLIVLNKMGNPNENFTYWHQAEEVQKFCKTYKPEVIVLGSINPDLQIAVRNHGLTLGQVAEGNVEVAELKASKFKIRAQQVRKQISEELDKVGSVVLP